MSVELKSANRANVLHGAALVYELIHNKAKRDLLRSQQIAMRNQTFNPAPPPMAQSYSQTYGAQNAGMAYGSHASNYGAQPYARGAPAYGNNQQPTAAAGYGGGAHNRTPFQNAFSSKELGGGLFLESVVVPSAKIAMITGGNDFLAELEAVSRATVSVSVNSQNNQFSEISFRGSKQQISMARGRLQELFENDVIFC